MDLDPLVDTTLTSWGIGRRRPGELAHVNKAIHSGSFIKGFMILITLFDDDMILYL
jgi:hypothetical protein